MGRFAEKWPQGLKMAIAEANLDAGMKPKETRMLLLSGHLPGWDKAEDMPYATVVEIQANARKRARKAAAELGLSEGYRRVLEKSWTVLEDEAAKAVHHKKSEERIDRIARIARASYEVLKLQRAVLEKPVRRGNTKTPSVIKKDIDTEKNPEAARLMAEARRIHERVPVQPGPHSYAAEEVETPSNGQPLAEQDPKLRASQLREGVATPGREGAATDLVREAAAA